VTYIFIVVPYFYQTFNGYSRTLSVPMLSNRNFLKPFHKPKRQFVWSQLEQIFG
jgi:hypothetical protein